MERTRSNLKISKRSPCSPSLNVQQKWQHCFTGEPRRLRLPPYLCQPAAHAELHDMFGSEYEDAAHSSIGKNAVGWPESVWRRDHQRAAHGTRLATGARQEGPVERVRHGQLYGRHNRAGLRKARFMTHHFTPSSAPCRTVNWNSAS